MTKEERDWLEAAMKQYTFNDTDRMKELLETLKS
jgi:Zn-dependent M16 (insulinase) family peptidase